MLHAIELASLLAGIQSSLTVLSLKSSAHNSSKPADKHPLSMQNIGCDADAACQLLWQVLSEMIISNESNILTSRVLSHFNRSRQLLFTIKLRYKDLEKVRRVTHLCLQDLLPACSSTYLGQGPHSACHLP